MKNIFGYRKYKKIMNNLPYELIIIILIYVDNINDIYNLIKSNVKINKIVNNEINIYLEKYEKLNNTNNHWLHEKLLKYIKEISKYIKIINIDMNKKELKNTIMKKIKKEYKHNYILKKVIRFYIYCYICKYNNFLNKHYYFCYSCSEKVCENCANICNICNGYHCINCINEWI